MIERIIPYSCQNIDDADIEAVVNVLQSEMLTQGPAIPIFENSLSQLVGSKYAVATNSATSALHISCLALGVKKGDIVWTSAISFVASANCALYCGASIDFVDINLSSHNMCVNALQEKLRIAYKTNSLPKVVIPLHMAGNPCDMSKIKDLSNDYGFKIIEDASHALGATYDKDKVGSCSFSDITIFSFHPVKMITSGEGGMALTNNEVIANSLQSLRTHGIHGNSLEFINTQANEIWNYQQIALGFNYRMTDIHAALGSSQLQKLNKFVNVRNSIADLYKNQINDKFYKFQHIRAGVVSSYHLFTLRVPNGHQVQLYNKLRQLGVMTNLHYIPIYRHPYYRNSGFDIGYCLNAEEYFKTVMSIPIHTKMVQSDLDFLIEHLNEYANNERK